jgi:hypothetical protein
MILSGDVLIAKPKSSKENSEPFPEPIRVKSLSWEISNFSNKNEKTKNAFIKHNGNFANHLYSYKQEKI